MWASAWASVTISGAGADREQRVEPGRARAGGVDREHLAEAGRASGPVMDASSPLKSRTSANSVQVRSVGHDVVDALAGPGRAEHEPVHVAGLRTAVACRRGRRRCPGPRWPKAPSALRSRAVPRREPAGFSSSVSGSRISRKRRAAAGSSQTITVEPEPGEEARPSSPASCPRTTPTTAPRTGCRGATRSGRPSAGSNAKWNATQELARSKGQRQAGQEREAVEAGRAIASRSYPPTASEARPAAPRTASRPGPMKRPKTVSFWPPARNCPVRSVPCGCASRVRRGAGAILGHHLGARLAS